MRAAIYSRKSKFTGKGESIENQIEMCKNYLANVNIKDFSIYEDEGFSGKNFDRPQFKKLLKDAKNRKFDTLICYRLDRISRNIADFSNLINELGNLGIGFISIKEQFDTTTPMGRAMMYIASVFAQLERETIAERVKDNMLELAKTGRWLGGQTPLGFKSEVLTYFDSEMNQKRMYKLSPEKDELKVVKLVYDKYLELHSLSKVTKYLTQNLIKSKTGNTVWNKRTVQDILTNPVYVKANNKVFNYLKNKGMNVVGTPDNKHGILTYNKKKGAKVFRDVTEWIAAISKHNGIISSKDWLEIQDILSSNKSKAPRLGKTNNALLTGILKCKKCGSPMKIIHGKASKDGKKIFYYKCSLKESSGNTRCNNPNVRADELENAVISKLKKISFNSNLIIKELKKSRENFNELNPTELKIDTIKRKKTQLQSLIDQLSSNPNIAKYLIPKIEAIGKEIESLENSITQIKNINSKSIKSTMNIKIMLDFLNNFSIIDSLEVNEKKLILNSILKEVTWDGNTGSVDISLQNNSNSN